MFAADLAFASSSSSGANKIAGGYALRARRMGVRRAGSGGPGEIASGAASIEAAWRRPIGVRRGPGRQDPAIERFQGLSLGLGAAVARPPSHGIGQAIERQWELDARLLIANLTDAHSSRSDPGAQAWPIEVGQGGLPPFAAAGQLRGSHPADPASTKIAPSRASILVRSCGGACRGQPDQSGRGHGQPVIIRKIGSGSGRAHAPAASLGARRGGNGDAVFQEGLAPLRERRTRGYAGGWTGVKRR